MKRGCEVRCSKGEQREVVQRGGALEKCREIAFSVVLFDLHWAYSPTVTLRWPTVVCSPYSVPKVPQSDLDDLWWPLADLQWPVVIQVGDSEWPWPVSEWVSEWPTVTLRWHTVTIRWPKVTLGDLLWVILRWLGVTIKWLILTPRDLQWPLVTL